MTDHAVTELASQVGHPSCLSSRWGRPSQLLPAAPAKPATATPGADLAPAAPPAAGAEHC